LDAANSAPPRPAAEPTPRDSAPASAERRQLTVMFCDLVGSTELRSPFRVVHGAGCHPSPTQKQDARKSIGRQVVEVVARPAGPACAATPPRIAAPPS
jgi:hypothetical protein